MALGAACARRGIRKAEVVEESLTVAVWSAFIRQCALSVKWVAGFRGRDTQVATQIRSGWWLQHARHDQPHPGLRECACCSRGGDADGEVVKKLLRAIIQC